jgi:hypothetical protein
LTNYDETLKKFSSLERKVRAQKQQLDMMNDETANKLKDKQKVIDEAN